MGRQYIPSCAVLLLGLAAVAGCAAGSDADRDPVDACYRDMAQSIRRKPPLTCLETLDGRCVPLAPFFERCAAYWPNCVLYDKFYHWPSRIEERVAQTSSGPVRHAIRVYLNLRSTCDPAYTDPGRTHGDVAEFYDGRGRFIGLAVYMGKGLYVPLPYTE